MTRRPLFALFAALLGLVAACGLGELLARALGEPPLAAVVRDAVQARGPDALIQAVPDGRIFAGRPGGTPDQALNARGLRDPAVGAGCSLVLLGDSVAWGHGLTDPQILARRLEERLPVQAHTLAFPGWNTAQEAAALQVVGPELAPDLVLVLWVPNDAASVELQDGDAVYVQRRVRLLPGLAPSTQVTLWTRSWLFRRIGDALGSQELLLEAEEHRAALADIAATARGLGAVPLMAQVPPLVDYPGSATPWGAGRPAAPYVREGPWRAAVDAARSAGMRRFDLTAAVAGSDPTALRLTPDDRVHPSAEGVARFAEALAPWIAAELPAACAQRE